jgi:hypothetical protein
MTTPTDPSPTKITTADEAIDAAEQAIAVLIERECSRSDQRGSKLCGLEDAQVEIVSLRTRIAPAAPPPEAQRLAFLESEDDCGHERRYWRNETDGEGDIYDECVICALDEMRRLAAPPPDVAELVETIRARWAPYQDVHGDDIRRLCDAALSRPPAPGVDVEQAEIAAHRSQADQDLRDAVQWVLNDAAYKAPETLDVLSKRWLDKLSRAFFPSRPPQPATEEK